MRCQYGLRSPIEEMFSAQICSGDWKIWTLQIRPRWGDSPSSGGRIATVNAGQAGVFLNQGPHGANAGAIVIDDDVAEDLVTRWGNGALGSIGGLVGWDVIALGRPRPMAGGLNGPHQRRGSNSHCGPGRVKTPCWAMSTLVVPRRKGTVGTLCASGQIVGVIAHGLSAPSTQGQHSAALWEGGLL